MKIVVPERVSIIVAKLLAGMCGCDAAYGRNEPKPYVDSCVSFADGCQCRADADAIITAALQKWIASGEARPGSMYESDHAWYAQTLQMSPEPKPVLIIRMEPDNE